MTALAARVLSGLRDRRLAGPDDRVVGALSGGPDSVALTLLLDETLPRVGARLVGVAHLHHGLRGEFADQDETFCAELAARLGLPLVSERIDVVSLARARRCSTEAAGHVARADFFERARTALHATRVATGHTKNDQAETFLLRATRGAGLRGLGGIRPVHGRIIRPLLDVSRGDVLAYLAALGQPFREDASNQDPSITRNRVRHQVLPALERGMGMPVVDTLARTAALAADDDAYLDDVATREASRIVLVVGASVTLDAAVLRNLPGALRRRVVFKALERVSSAAVSATAVERLVALATTPEPGSVTLHGVRADRQGDVIRVRRVPPGRGSASRDAMAGHVIGLLPVPGILALPAGGHLEAELRVRDEARELPGGRDVAVLDADRVPLPLTVRLRRAGDRILPLGLGGHKKLQDLFVDRKVPRDQRDGVPLVVDADARIVFVVGHAVAEAARVTPATSSVLLLEYRR